MKAYNDWMVEEWCAPSRGMNIPLCIMPLWDVELAAAEIQRNADRGVRAFCFSELPHHLKLPTIHSGGWDPVFQVCNDTGVTLCMHIGSSSTNPAASPDAPGGVGGTLAFNNSMASLADWLFSGKLIEFPKLKLAYSEGQIGWIPYALERADTVWEQHDSWQHSKERIPEPPSTYYYGRIFGCFTADHHGLHSLPEVGEDNICFETDYPHTDTTWPNRKEYVEKMLAGLRREARVQGAARQRDQDAGARPGLTGRHRHERRAGAEDPPLGHEGAEAVRRRPPALARRGRRDRTARRVCAWARSRRSWSPTPSSRERCSYPRARRGAAAHARRPDSHRGRRKPVHAARQGVGPPATRRSRRRSGRRRSTRASPASTRSSPTS